MPPASGDAPSAIPMTSLALLGAGAACLVLCIALRARLLSRRALQERAGAAASVPPLRWFVAGVLGWVAWVFGTALVMSLLPREPAPSLPARALASCPGYLAGLAVMVAALRGDRARRHAAGLRVSPHDARDGVIAAALGVPMLLAVGVLSFVAADALARATGALPPDDVAHGTLREILDLRAHSGLSWWALAVALQVVVLAPLFEEALYRGCLQSALLSATGRPWASIVAASALFAGVHIPIVPWHALPTLLCVGVVCGLAFERTGRLGPAVLVHAAFNAVNLGAALLSAPGAG